MIWNELILNPMTNALLWLYHILGNNFVLALTVFTIGIRLIMLPLNLRQQRSMMRTQKMQPQIREIQQKYRDNPQKMQEEYQKIGYNPADTLMGCLPLLIQMPILFGLYRAIFFLLGSTPQSLFELANRAYSFIDLGNLLPISNEFLWLNLGQPDPFLVLPVLVFGTMFLQQKLMTPAKNEDDTKKNNNKKKKQDQQPEDPTAAMTQTMQYTMPIMFGFFSMQFAAGLSIYFILSNLIGIGQSFYIRRARDEAEAAWQEEEKWKEIDTGPSKEAKLESSKESPSQNGSSSNYIPKSKRQSSKRKRRSTK